MDLTELGDMGSGCEDENCSLAAGLLREDCSNLDCQREEHIFGLIELVCVTVFYIPLMLLGLVGNILTILVVWLRPHMRSSTYLYLSSMAVSDLLILLLLPLDLYKLWRPRPWPLGDLACKLTVFLSECCTFCTILHITFLSLERYLAVCWPITAKTLVTRHRTRVLIGCLWLGAAVSAAPVLVMVGVEEVGGEELGLSAWREDGGWMDVEGELGGLIMDGEGGRSGYTTFADGALDGIKWEEDTVIGQGGERKLGIVDVKEGQREINDENQGESKENMDVDGQQQSKMREDEGGGGEDDVHKTDADNSECRCTHYAISSGLLSAMMIVSNLYFLVPVCVLGLVYSLIGRTLWLRPQRDSRRDKSHRHTVKMLGVIVLAFVLCWLPFHVGRTIFTLSLGTGADGHEAPVDENSRAEMLYDIRGDTRNSTHTDTAHPGLNGKTSATGNIAHANQEGHETSCDKRSDGTRTDKHSRSSHDTSHSRQQHAEKNTYINTHTDAKHINIKQTVFGENTNSNNKITHPHMNTTFYSHANTHPSMPIYTEAHTLSVTQNGITICTNNNSYTGKRTMPSLAPTGLHSGTHSNDTHTPADAHLYFLYYLSQYFNLVSSVFFYLSAAVNPLLYNLMSARYRRAVHSLFHTHVHAQAHHLRTFTTRHSTTTL